jgi:hypothetical protein
MYASVVQRRGGFLLFAELLLRRCPAHFCREVTETARRRLTFSRFRRKWILHVISSAPVPSSPGLLFRVWAARIRAESAARAGAFEELEQARDRGSGCPASA